MGFGQVACFTQTYSRRHVSGGGEGSHHTPPPFASLLREDDGGRGGQAKDTAEAERPYSSSVAFRRPQGGIENISRGPSFGDFVTVRTEASMQDVTVARLQKKYRLPSFPFFKCNVLRESLSVDSQNIPSAKLKRRGSWVISMVAPHPSGYSRHSAKRMLGGGG
jgi:hypothetical protein